MEAEGRNGIDTIMKEMPVKELRRTWTISQSQMHSKIYEYGAVHQAEYVIILVLVTTVLYVFIY